MTTTVPPEKSTPSGRPPLAMIVAMPAPMTSADRTMACQRHLMKSNLDSVRKRMRTPDLNAQLSRAGRPARENQLEQRARNEHGREDVGQQAEDECRREATNEPCSEL